MSLNLHFPESSWETVSQNWSAWWAGEHERVLIVLECVEPQDEATPHYASTFLGNYSVEIPADELLELFIPRLQATPTWVTLFRDFGPTSDRESWQHSLAQSCMRCKTPPGSHLAREGKFPRCT